MRLHLPKLGRIVGLGKFIAGAVRVIQAANGATGGGSNKDECVVCGKRIRKHRKVTGEGRVCSVACAHFWVENMS
jgi:hypothetical protein